MSTHSLETDLKTLTAIKEARTFYVPPQIGLLELKGADRDRFLHNQTTNNINALAVGSYCDTVFVNSTGRTLDLTRVYKQENALWVKTSPQRRQFLWEWMDRYLFPMDKVELTDLSSQFTCISLIGPTVAEALQSLDFLLPEVNQFVTVPLGTDPVLLTASNDLDLPGYTLIVPLTALPQLENLLLEKGFLAISDRLWEHCRIMQGRPIPDQELAEDYNPLEAGLWRTVSFEKGCYIGQETIARLNTYKGVKQRLWGVQLSEAVSPDTVVTIGAEKVGILTSMTDLETPFGLAYIRTKAGGEGLQVQLGNASGKVVAVPFLSHEYYQPNR